jgi:hypothetical protein
VVWETSKRSIGGRLFRGGEDENSGFVAGLKYVSALVAFGIWRIVALTSPMAKYLPSGLKETQVAALTRSLAVQDRPGESDQSAAPGVNGLKPSADSLDERPRNSEAELVGVDGE